MTTAEAWDLLLKAAGLFGGVGAVTVALAAYLSKLAADRSIESHKSALARETERLKGELAKDTETHKLKLRKEEILFAKQIEAASAYIDLHQKLRPAFSWPDKDWAEACNEVVEDFGKFETALQNYLKAHGAVLSSEVRKGIKDCENLASVNKFAIAGSQYGNWKEAEKAASEVLETLEKIEGQILESIQAH